MVQATLQSSGPRCWPIASCVQTHPWEPNLLQFPLCHLPILDTKPWFTMSWCSVCLARWCLWNKWNLGTKADFQPVFSLLLLYVIKLGPDVSWCSVQSCLFSQVTLQSSRAAVLLNQSTPSCIWTLFPGFTSHTHLFVWTVLSHKLCLHDFSDSLWDRLPFSL